MESKATTVDAYLKSLPAERREAISTLRDVMKQHIPEGYEEGMQYGMISYYIPLERFPHTYNGQPFSVAALASQKNHMAVYLMGVYSEPGGEKWFRELWAKSGKKLDMGKSCVRFKKLEDVSLEAIGAALERTPPEKMMAIHDAAHGGAKKAAAKGKRAATVARKKPASRKK